MPDAKPLRAINLENMGNGGNSSFTVAPEEPKKTMKVVIQIESRSGIEIHETTMEYEGMSHDEKTGTFSFFGKPSIFAGQSPWVIKTMKSTSPQSIVKEMEQEGAE